jgi:hypothetical protein
MQLYLRSWFPLDFLVLIPWGVMISHGPFGKADAAIDSSDSGVEVDKYVKALRMARMLRMVRMLRGFKALARLGRRMAAVRAILQEGRQIYRGGDDGLSNLDGIEYVEYRLVPLKKRYEKQIARENSVVVFCQYSSVAFTTIGASILNAMQLANADSTLLGIQSSRWIAVTTLLAGNLIAVLTYFQIHTVLRAKKKAYRDCVTLIAEWGGETVEQKEPALVHGLVVRTEDAFAAQTCSWVQELDPQKTRSTVEVSGSAAADTRPPTRQDTTQYP